MSEQGLHQARCSPWRPRPRLSSSSWRSACWSITRHHSLPQSDIICGFQVAEGHLSVRADLGDGAHALRLPRHRVDIGQWILVSLHRHDNLFTLQLEQGGGSREVQARLGSHRKIVIDPTSVMVGNGPKTGNTSSFLGEEQILFLLPHHLLLLPTLVHHLLLFRFSSAFCSLRVSAGCSLQWSETPFGQAEPRLGGSPGEAGHHVGLPE